MIPKECKRLAEVDFPIALVSKHAIWEKPIVYRHPQSLQQWWARRPLAGCRAMLLALLLPDPCDTYCPKDFKDKATELLPKVLGKVGPGGKNLREALLKFIGDFSNWGLSSNQTYLEVSRGLVRAAHPEETPLVVDPFAGGGSIPLEALRLVCETFASDLNPVACLILKVMLEEIPRHGPELADELRRIGKEIKEAAERELKEFYPDDPDGSKPIAYLWARTVRCEAPNCGAEIPLMRSFWLCKKAGRKRALRPIISSFPQRAREKNNGSEVEFEIFEPKNDNEVPAGTVTRAKATCLCCGTVLPPERVRGQLSGQRGGADVIFDDRGNRIGGARLLAIVSLRPNDPGRHYRISNSNDYTFVLSATKHLEEVTAEPLPNGLSRVPDEPTPWQHGHRAVSSPRVYGMQNWGDLFTARQKLALITISSKIPTFADSQALRELLSSIVSRLADRLSSLLGWDIGGEKLGHVFNRQALPMVWDFAEGVPIADATGSYKNILRQIEGAVDGLLSLSDKCGQIEILDARNSSLPDDTANVWFTDPPYYDAVPYSDISDFFFVWLKRILNDHQLMHDPCDRNNPLTPKHSELTVTTFEGKEFKPKTRGFFEVGLTQAFAEGRRVLREDGVGCIIFAHKTTEGWEAFLSGLIKGGWTITGSWPISTERSGRLNARETASLATSIHLVCRPRPEDAPIGDWGDVLRELPKRVGDWMERLQPEGIRGADLVFACIGPALEIFSRYSKVVDVEEREIPLGGDSEGLEPHKRGFLSYVWEVVGRTALEQVLGTADLPTPRLRQAGAKDRDNTVGLPPGALAQAGALEEDARLTALFLWTLQSTNGESPSPQPSPTEGRGSEDEEEDEEEETPKKKKQGYCLIFDVVRRFAQPLGIHLPEWEGRIIETEKGVVRLFSVKERGKQLFGEESISVAGFRIEEQARRDPQMKFDFAGRSEEVTPKIRGRRSKSPQPPFDKGGRGEGFIKSGQEGIKKHETTTLDRVHAAMLLQASGQTNALRALLKGEQDRGPDFLRLANALSALYPKISEEKRLLDAMLVAIPR
jgi:putative DNA methylase